MAITASNRSEAEAAIATRMQCPMFFPLFLGAATVLGAPLCSNGMLLFLLGSCRKCSWSRGPRRGGVNFDGWILLRLGRERFVAVECVRVAPVLTRRRNVNDSQRRHGDQFLSYPCRFV